MQRLSESIIIAWPLLIFALAVWFHKKQNSKKAWTGGPISWPKSIWLVYTVSTWFLLPIAFLIHPDLPSAAVLPLCVHLASWWIRGPLELVMIYKWFNWSPRYGISHDLFHAIALVWSSFHSGLLSSIASLQGFEAVAALFIFILFFGVLAELLFARLFLSARSQQEESENIYFASDDPKWKRINRVTAAVVTVVCCQLVIQSFLLIFKPF